MHIELVIAITIVCIIGIVEIIYGVKHAAKNQEPVGTLRIDTSDPDGPYLFLELHTPIDEVMKQQIVTLDVNLENYISQK